VNVQRQEFLGMFVGAATMAGPKIFRTAFPVASNYIIFQTALILLR
jgi:hypothetical protein